MGLRVALVRSVRGVLGRDLHRELGMSMKVYDREQLKRLLGIGNTAAYRILREYGFRIGSAGKSPLRITEEGVNEYVRQQQARNDLGSRA